MRTGPRNFDMSGFEAIWDQNYLPADMGDTRTTVGMLREFLAKFDDGDFVSYLWGCDVTVVLRSEADLVQALDGFRESVKGQNRATDVLLKEATEIIVGHRHLTEQGRTA